MAEMSLATLKDEMPAPEQGPSLATLPDPFERAGLRQRFTVLPDLSRHRGETRVVNGKPVGIPGSDYSQAQLTDSQAAANYNFCANNNATMKLDTELGWSFCTSGGITNRGNTYIYDGNVYSRDPKGNYAAHPPGTSVTTNPDGSVTIESGA